MCAISLARDLCFDPIFARYIELIVRVLAACPVVHRHTGCHGSACQLPDVNAVRRKAHAADGHPDVIHMQRREKR